MNYYFLLNVNIIISKHPSGSSSQLSNSVPVFPPAIVTVVIVHLIIVIVCRQYDGLLVIVRLDQMLHVTHLVPGDRPGGQEGEQHYQHEEQQPCQYQAEEEVDTRGRQTTRLKQEAAVVKVWKLI